MNSTRLKLTYFVLKKRDLLVTWSALFLCAKWTVEFQWNFDDLVQFWYNKTIVHKTDKPLGLGQIFTGIGMLTPPFGPLKGDLDTTSGGRPIPRASMTPALKSPLTLHLRQISHKNFAATDLNSKALTKSQVRHELVDLPVLVGIGFVKVGLQYPPCNLSSNYS